MAEKFSVIRLKSVIRGKPVIPAGHGEGGEGQAEVGDGQSCGNSQCIQDLALFSGTLE